MGKELDRNRSQQPLRTPSAPGDGPVYRRLAAFAGVVLRATSREVWDDAAALPATGGMPLKCAASASSAGSSTAWVALTM